MSNLTQAIQQAAFAHGIDVLIGHAHNDDDIASRLLRRMWSGWFDGVLLVGKLRGYHQLIEQLRQSQTHFVTVAHGTQAEPPLVNIDEVQGTHLALEYLYQLGHRRIAYIGSMLDAGIGERLAYFKQFAADFALNLPEGYLQTGVYTQAEAMQRTIDLLQGPDQPTAIFASSTWLGIGALQGARYLGVRVPEDLSLLGFDEIPQAASTFPPMTTVQQPIHEMAQEAVALLVHQINQDQAVHEVRRIIAPQLLIRASCEEPCVV
ncbi:MAG: LacI family transcriptional regulator [Anaerolineae bacterium]|nr:LacI family transcriptional regulator [Anaerolineae bacterium]